MTIYKDDLQKVYQLIEKPENWTQKAYMRDANGHDIGGDSHSLLGSDHPEACSFCILGAGLKFGLKTEDMYDALVPVMWQKYKALCSPNEFNDDRTHAEVLELLRNAIERAPVRP